MNRMFSDKKWKLWLTNTHPSFRGLTTTVLVYNIRARSISRLIGLATRRFNCSEYYNFQETQREAVSVMLSQDNFSFEYNHMLAGRSAAFYCFVENYYK